MEDQSADGDFRRQVADLLWEVKARFQGGSSGEGRAPPLSRGDFDVRASTPYLLLRSFRRLGSRLGTGGGPGAGILRELVLMEIARKSPTSPFHLRRRLGVPASTLSEMVESGVRRGLLSRRRHPGDGRTWLLEPTPAGLAEAGEAARRWRAADEALLEGLSPSERDQLRRLLRRAC